MHISGKESMAEYHSCREWGYKSSEPSRVLVGRHGTSCDRAEGIKRGVGKVWLKRRGWGLTQPHKAPPAVSIWRMYTLLLVTLTAGSLIRDGEQLVTCSSISQEDMSLIIISYINMGLHLELYINMMMTIMTKSARRFCALSLTQSDIHDPLTEPA